MSVMLEHRIEDSDELAHTRHERDLLGFAALELLRNVEPRRSGYGPRERTLKDKYVDAYFGKEYSPGGALEVMSMSFQGLLTGYTGYNPNNSLIRDMLRKDPEIINLALGLLFTYAP